MVRELIKALNKTKAEVQALEARFEKDLKATLAELHKVHGFDSVPNFVKAVKAASKEAEGKGRKAGKELLQRAKRAEITADVRALVKKLASAGKTGAQIAKEAGISIPSVQNVKKALGLVNSRKKAAPQPKPKAPRAPAKKKTAPKSGKKRTAPGKRAAPVPPAAAPAAAEVNPPSVS